MKVLSGRNFVTLQCCPFDQNLSKFEPIQAKVKDQGSIEDLCQ